ncbi:MAG: PKD domain-containing protein [Saprospiraceae bacterium]|nr:PKD domain-containing protein [Saprospiraceae bacterium]MCB9342766.1 PKD domain-containing protein [Lewinellaceae bacterium]
MVEQKKTGKQKNRETILLIAVAVVGLAGLVVLQLANKKGSGVDPKSVLQADRQQDTIDAQASAAIQKIPGELLRTSEYPEAGRPFKFYMSKSSQGPEYSLDFGDGSPRKVFNEGYVTHTFKHSGPCVVTLFASYEGEQVQLDTMRKVVARVKVDIPVGPIIDY